MTNFRLSSSRGQGWDAGWTVLYHAPFFCDQHMTMATGQLIDIGVNLGHDSFDKDRAAVLAAAQSAGVARMVITGTSVASSNKAALLAASKPGVLYSTAGVHPHDASGFTTTSCAELQALTTLPQVVAVGETGLDFHRDFSPRPLQERAFAEQLQLAAQTALPVFLHQREAHSRFLALLQEQRDALVRGVVHCFTGTREELYDYLDLDMYIGITGWVCDERRGLPVQELLGDIPPTRLLLETDAPYLLPRNMAPKPRDRRNEPANLTWVLAQIAACLGRPAVEIAEETTRNAEAFFGLAADSAGTGETVFRGK